MCIIVFQGILSVTGWLGLKISGSQTQLHHWIFKAKLMGPVLFLGSQLFCPFTLVFSFLIRLACIVSVVLLKEIY